MYCLFCVVLCIVCVYMCIVPLPLGGYPIAVKYIISYQYDRTKWQHSVHEINIWMDARTQRLMTEAVE